jgi:23S rRNA pseudouridine955/2504/2580 synthase
MKEFVILKGDAGQTSFKYLKRIFKEAPNSFLYKMMRKKNFVLNDKKIEGNEMLCEGDVLKAYISDDAFDMFSGTSNAPLVEEYREAYLNFGNPDIVYEDEHIIVLNKPTDMLSQKAKRKDLSANEWLIGYMLFNKMTDRESLRKFTPSICNRLDRNTGGLLLFGKTVFGVNTLNRLLKDRSLDKYYKTVVFGELKESLEIKGYLKKDEERNKVYISETKTDDEESYIETVIEPIEYIKDKDITILSVKLVTGKPHQIRAHLSSIGHPIIGDYKYGKREENEKYKAFYKITFQILYCTKVVFPSLPDYPELSLKTIELNEPVIFSKLRAK